jgi:hypothetical protein
MSRARSKSVARFASAIADAEQLAKDVDGQIQGQIQGLKLKRKKAEKALEEYSKRIEELTALKGKAKLLLASSSVLVERQEETEDAGARQEEGQPKKRARSKPINLTQAIITVLEEAEAKGLPYEEIVELMKKKKLWNWKKGVNAVQAVSRTCRAAREIFVKNGKLVSLAKGRAESSRTSEADSGPRESIHRELQDPSSFVGKSIQRGKKQMRVMAQVNPIRLKDANGSEQLKRSLVGKRIEVLFKQGKGKAYSWYPGTLVSFNSIYSSHHILYDDGEEEDLVYEESTNSFYVWGRKGKKVTWRYLNQYQAPAASASSEEPQSNMVHDEDSLLLYFDEPRDTLGFGFQELLFS